MVALLEQERFILNLELFKLWGNFTDKMFADLTPIDILLPNVLED
jgi:hypothetical protein